MKLIRDTVWERSEKPWYRFRVVRGLGRKGLTQFMLVVHEGTYIAEIANRVLEDGRRLLDARWYHYLIARKRDIRFLRIASRLRWRYGIWRHFVRENMSADEIMQSLEIFQIAEQLARLEEGNNEKF